MELDVMSTLEKIMFQNLLVLLVSQKKLEIS